MGRITGETADCAAIGLLWLKRGSLSRGKRHWPSSFLAWLGRHVPSQPRNSYRLIRDRQVQAFRHSFLIVSQFFYRRRMFPLVLTFFKVKERGEDHRRDC